MVTSWWIFEANVHRDEHRNDTTMTARTLNTLFLAPFPRITRDVTPRVFTFLFHVSLVTYVEINASNLSSKKHSKVERIVYCHTDPRTFKKRSRSTGHGPMPSRANESERYRCSQNSRKLHELRQKTLLSVSFKVDLFRHAVRRGVTITVRSRGLRISSFSLYLLFLFLISLFLSLFLSRFLQFARPFLVFLTPFASTPQLSAIIVMLFFYSFPPFGKNKGSEWLDARRRKHFALTNNDRTSSLEY